MRTARGRVGRALLALCGEPAPCSLRGTGWTDLAAPPHLARWSGVAEATAHATRPRWPHPGRGIATSAAAAARAAREFRLAQTGEGIKECELVQWFVEEGDAVEAFGRVCEVQSDKATLEITSPYAGRVQALRHSPGAVVEVGAVLADIIPDDDGGEGEGAAASDAAADAATTTTASSSSSASEPEPAAAGARPEPPVQTSPAVRRLAAEHGVALASLRGSGPGGRVTKGDLLAAIDAAAGPGAAAAAAAAQLPLGQAPAAAAPQPSLQQLLRGDAAAAVAAAPPPPGDLGSVAVPLRGYRKAMLRSMTAAAAIPHFHFCEEVCVDALAALREGVRDDPALAGARLTLLPFFIKAAALALEEHPLVNSSLSEDGAAILLHRTTNIGVAMATEHGLVVPAIKDAGGRSVAELARELARLQAGAAAGRLSPEDLAGGTFTLSNIGSLGGTYATPLVHGGQAAILALGRARRLPRLAPGGGDAVVAASVMGVSAGADHRIVDGASLAAFVRTWAGYVEAPGRMLLRA